MAAVGPDSRALDRRHLTSQGELWWYEVPEDKRRPVLVVSRNVAASAKVVVAPVTRTERDLPTWLPVGLDEGLVVDSYANFDDLRTAPKANLTLRIGSLGAEAKRRICDALDAMADR